LKFEKDNRDIAWGILAEVNKKEGKKKEAMKVEQKRKILKKDIKPSP